MGKSLVVAGLIAAGVSAASSVIGGVQANKAANQQAENAQEEATARARQEARANIEAESRQKVAFLSSGVSLVGSPLLTLNETKYLGDENIDNVIASGENQASSIRSSGRQALLGGVLKAGSTVAGGYSDFKSAGGLSGGGS